jgi:hypothetical protein
MWIFQGQKPPDCFALYLMLMWQDFAKSSPDFSVFICGL